MSLLDRFVKSFSTIGGVVNDLSKSGFLGSIRSGISNWWKGFTGSGVTQRDVELNQLSMQNVEDEASRQVEGYKKAGINPALMMSGGASTAPQASSSGVSGNMSELLQVLLIPAQLKMMKAQSQQYKDVGEAALINARAADKNADTNVGNLRVNERNASVNERNSEIAEMRQQIDAFLARSQVKVNDATIDKMAADSAQIRVVTDQLPERLELAKKDTDAKVRSSVAALNSSIASIRQAAIAEKLSDSEIALRESVAALNWSIKEGRDISNQFLSEKERSEIDDLLKHKEYLESSARNLDRNAKVQWTETIAGYLGAGARVLSGAGALLGAF